MSVAELGIAWFKAVLIAPFVAILFGAVGKVMVMTYQATQIEGNRELTQAQDSIFHNGMLALDLLELGSSIQTWVLFGGFLLAIYLTAQSIILYQP